MDKEQRVLNNEFREAIIKLEQHARTSNEEVGKIQICIESMKTDIEWIKKGIWIILGAILTGIVVAIFEIITK